MAQQLATAERLLHALGVDFHLVAQDEPRTPPFLSVGETNDLPAYVKLSIACRWC